MAFPPLCTLSGGNRYEEECFRQESRPFHGALRPAAQLCRTDLRIPICTHNEGCPQDGTPFPITKCQEVFAMQKNLFVKSFVRSMEQYGRLLDCVGQL